MVWIFQFVTFIYTQIKNSSHFIWFLRFCPKIWEAKYMETGERKGRIERIEIN